MRFLCVALGTALVACQAVTPGQGVQRSGTFVLAVGEERLRVRLADSTLAEKARRMIMGDETQKIVMGDLARGDGGFNVGYGWHLKPQTVSFVDITTEVCDGRPSDVQAAVNYWVDTVKRYCPWSGRFVSEVP